MAIDRNQLFNEVSVGMRKDKTLQIRTKRFANEVAKDVRKNVPSPSNPHPLTKTGPYATGKSEKSVIVERRRDRFKLPRYRVVSYSEIMHFLEYGTKIDNPDSRSPWGRYTPTAAYGPFSKAAFKHGGTPD